MVPRLRVVSAAVLVGYLIAVSAYAQEFTGPTPARAPANLAFIEGHVDVVNSGVTEAAEPPMMLLEGDIVRTRNGRAEIVFGDGTLLHVAADSELEIFGDERIRLLTGRAVVRMSHAAARPYVLDTPSSSVRLEAEGEYGISATPDGHLQVSVTRGSATVGDAQQWSLRGGQMFSVDGVGARPLIESFNSARFDGFDAWAHDRANGIAGTTSAAQLPYELRPYASTLDQYGRWDYVEPYGQVWFPSVGAAWRPYYDGSWSWTQYGWTWRGHDRWAWPTHHFGRWGHNGAFWYWIPANSWAPAWVTWSVANGYVSWAPFGWNTPGRFWGHVDHPGYAPSYSPWRGWTVLPRHQFGPRRNVRTHAIDGDRLDDATRRALLTGATRSPAVEDVAVPRDSFRSPREGGNVRRPPPRVPASRIDRPRPADEQRPNEPSNAQPRSWGQAAGRARSGGERQGEGERAAPRSTPRSGGDSAGERRGGVRSPGAGSAPRSGGKASPPPSASQPQSKGDGGGPRGAVPRSGSSRRPGN